MSKETSKEVKNAECLQQLADGPFKKFYLENPKEQKFLFSKVKPEELSLFSETEFSLADVLKCRFIETYLKKRNVKRLTFKKNLLKYIGVCPPRKGLERECKPKVAKTLLKEEEIAVEKD